MMNITSEFKMSDAPGRQLGSELRMNSKCCLEKIIQNKNGSKGTQLILWIFKNPTVQCFC